MAAAGWRWRRNMGHTCVYMATGGEVPWPVQPNSRVLSVHPWVDWPIASLWQRSPVLHPHHAALANCPRKDARGAEDDADEEHSPEALDAAAECGTSVPVVVGKSYHCTSQWSVHRTEHGPFSSGSDGSYRKPVAPVTVQCKHAVPFNASKPRTTFGVKRIYGFPGKARRPQKWMLGQRHTSCVVPTELARLAFIAPRSRVNVSCSASYHVAFRDTVLRRV